MRTEHRRMGLASTLVRVGMGRRLETGLSFAVVSVREALYLLVGLHMAQVVVGACAGALVCYGPTRRVLLRRAGAEAYERFYAKSMARSGLFERVPVPELLHGGRSAIGWVFMVGLSPQVTADDLARGAERLAVAFGARAVRTWRDPRHAGRAQLAVSYTDSLAQEFRWPWAGCGPVDLWRPFPLGYSEEGYVLWVALAEHHVLVGGEPGAGKSNALSLVVAAAAADPAVELWLFDGKLVELARWRELATRFVGADVAEATTALGELCSEMEARYELLLERDLRKVAPELGLGLVVVVIDELALYLQGPKAQRDAFAEALRDVVARGRAAGIVVVAATQKPAADVVPSSIRDLFGYRLALRCATKDASDTILGAGWAAEGYSAATVEASTRGVGWWLAEGSVPGRMRCYRLDDEDLAKCVRAAAIVRSERSEP